jgi:sugar phosphate isomerase/epimerase
VLPIVVYNGFSNLLKTNKQENEMSFVNDAKLKLALFSYSYHLSFGAHDVFKPAKPMDLFQFIDACADMGLDGVQIDAVHLKSQDSGYLDVIKASADARGMYLEYGITGIEKDDLLYHLDIARRLGANVMRTYIGFNPRDKRVDVAQETSRAEGALNAVKDIARQYGIKIAVENHCDLTTGELLSLIQRIDSPSVGVCVDLGNFMIHLENPVESVRRLAPYIVNTHFKDYAFSMENWGFKAFGVPLGEGMIDLKSILKILIEESGLDRITLEIPVEKEPTEEGTLAKEDAYVRQSVRHAREVLAIR